MTFSYPSLAALVCLTLTLGVTIGIVVMAVLSINRERP